MKKALSICILLSALTSCSQYALVNSDVYNNADLSQVKTFRIVTPDDGSLPPGMEMVTYYNIAAAIREQLVERGFTENPTSPILVNIGLTVKHETDVQAYTTPGTIVTTPPIAPPPPPRPAPAPAPVPAQAPVPVNPNLPDIPQSDPGLALPAGGPLRPVAQVPPRRPLPPPGPVYNGMAPWFMYPRSYYFPGQTQIVTSVYREGVLTMDIVNTQTMTPLYSSSVATILDNGDTQFRNLQGIAQAVKVLFSKFPVPMLPQYK